jgi:spore coat protein CotH
MISHGNCRPVILFLLLSALFCPGAAFPQILFPDPGPVFRDDLLPKISLFLPTDSLDRIYQNPESDHEMRTLFVFESGKIRDTIPVVGLRIRGNTSRQSGKKSFKISFNTFNTRQSFFGLEKMNLNGEHNDPSIIRSKLYWDLAKSFGIPAPRSNHILLYINNIFWGVYINVEQIDEEFADLRFGNKKGNLYKCLYPADLTYRSGNSNDYKFLAGSRRVYELQTNEIEDNYSDIAHFIDILNNTPILKLSEELDKVINVGTLLKILVLDVFAANWDGPFFNKNNFYLYKNTVTGKFELIPYDTDNTFGIDWFNIDWAARSIYEWSPQGQPRPLYTRVLEVPAYRNEYTRLFHEFLNSLNDGIFIHNIEQLKELFGPFIQSDPFYRKDYGWNMNDFTTSYTNRLSASHVKIGLLPYIYTRMSIARSMLDPISGISRELCGDRIRTYPNPVSDYLIIEGLTQPGYYELIDSSGVTILTGVLSEKTDRVRISQQPTGIYYLKIISLQRPIVTIKLVIIH